MNTKDVIEKLADSLETNDAVSGAMDVYPEPPDVEETPATQPENSTAVSATADYVRKGVLARNFKTLNEAASDARSVVNKVLVADNTSSHSVLLQKKAAAEMLHTPSVRERVRALK
jgi:hypothetical protein